MKNFLPVGKQVFAFLFVVCLSLSKSFAQNVTVAQDGSGNFTTVQAAINAAPTNQTAPYIIYIKNGKYKEKINIPSNKPFLQLVGQSVANVIITWDDYSGKPNPAGGTFGTANSATFTVSAADFTAINITFENTTGDAPQALAINVTGDRSAFKNCRFLGGQDTIFAGGTAMRQYFRNCYIDGTVDFIFGDARAVFDSCVIYPKTRIAGGNSFLTAANTKQAEPYGYVFRNCKITVNRGGSFYVLGRPWQNDASTADAAKSYNKTIFLNTTMGSSIQSVGWSTWDVGTDVTKITYAEYKSKKFDGSLVDVSQRVSWSQQLSDVRAAVYYNNDSLFGTWNPCAVAAGFCTDNPPDIAVSNFRGVKGTNTSTFTWNISWPIAGVKYEVLRSSDKTNFTSINEQTAANDSSVNFGYTENIPPPGVTYYYLIRASKTGLATHITDTVTISSTPTITIAGALGSFIQGVGTPSNPQSYTVSGSSLTNGLVITAPTGYEISANNGTTWNNSSNPIVLTPTSNGNVATTPISVRLNAATAGTYSGNIVHASLGADTVRLAVSGLVQNESLAVSQILEWWPLSTNNSDSAAVRAQGVTGTTPVLNNFYLSNGTTVASAPAYSPLHGQAFGATANGDGSWTPSPGGSVNHSFYEQYTVTASATHSLRIDSLIFTTSIYNSANGRLAIAFSSSGFTADSTQMPGATLASAVVLNNETGGNTTTYRFALAGATGVYVPSGQTLTFRLYYAVGSSSAGRYAKIKNVQVKGLAIVNPLTGDFRTHQSGNWKDLTTWERYDGTQWVSPAPEFPHYSNTSGTVIQSGHTVTHAEAFTEGFGYIPRRTKINNGGQLIVSPGINLNVANDGSSPPTATTDLQIDGTLTLLGTMGTNGNVSVVINGSFINSGTGLNLNNSGDTTVVGATGTYQHNVNNTTLIPGNTSNAFIFQPGSTFLVTGLTSASSGLFRNAVKYSNIVWNNIGQTASYAIRSTLDSTNVKGSFTVQSTGTSNLTFSNASSRKVFPGGYYQAGGTVNYRETGTPTDTLDLGGDFSVTGGTFNSNSAAGSSLLIRLNGTNKSINYPQATATNTNWEVNGVYSLGANLNIPTPGYSVKVNGTLNLGTYTVNGPANFMVMPGGIVSSALPAGLSGNIMTTGTTTFSPVANYIFNGTAPQTTGASLALANTVTINNSSDVTLSGNITATSLNLTAGRLVLGNNALTVSSVLNSSSTKYLVTNGTGMLSIRNIGAGANVFPVGPSTTSYNPVTVNNSGTPDTFSVSVKNTFDFAVTDANKVVNKQWTINESIPGGSNVTLSLSWTTADQAPGFDPANPVSIMRYNGTSWVYTPATITGAGTTASPYVATASGFTAFSPFGVVNSNAALPLKLLSFNAGYDNNVVNLWWSSTSEVNTASFEIERSADGRSFISIGSVIAKAAFGTNNYNFADPNPSDGIVYYRLKIVDKDGAFKYSPVTVVNSRLKGKVTLYPNPAHNSLSLTHNRATTNGTVEIITMDGRKVVMQKLIVNTTKTSIDVSDLAPGAYLLQVNNGVDKASIRFIKQ